MNDSDWSRFCLQVFILAHEPITAYITTALHLPSSFLALRLQQLLGTRDSNHRQEDFIDQNGPDPELILGQGQEQSKVCETND